MRPSPRVGYSLAITAAVAWASTGPGISFLLSTTTISPLALAFWRDAFVALACMGGVLIAGRGHLPQIGRGDLRDFAVMGIISVGLYHSLFVTSIALNGAALSIVLIYLYPAFVSLGAHLFFKEEISGQQIAALILAIIGCGLLVRIYDPVVLRVNWLGVLVGVGSAVMHAGYVLFNQRAVSRHSAWLSLALTMSFGALTLLLLNTITGGPSSLFTFGANPTPWLWVVALALGPTLGGYAAFTNSLRYIPGRISSVLMVIEAPLATLIAVGLLGEHIGPIQMFGMLLVLLAAVLPSLRLRLPGRVPATQSSVEAGSAL
ncbi:MAG: EamA family transporter [Oscillochloris sp.]|nr:EamA family transporter [Oscillochloris sp.]